MRPATGAVDGEDVMDLGLPTPDHTDPEVTGPTIPSSLLIVWGGPRNIIIKGRAKCPCKCFVVYCSVISASVFKVSIGNLRKLEG